MKENDKRRSQQGDRNRIFKRQDDGSWKNDFEIEKMSFEGDDMGIDEIDHFDFDDEDIEKFRHNNLHQNEDEYEEEKVPSFKKKKSKRLSPQAGETVFDIKEKKKTNKEILRVTYLMVFMFLGMIGYFVYFNAVESREVINNVHNRRLAKMAEQVIRGSILSSDGDILACTVTEEDNSYREYPYDCVFSHVVGTIDINKSGIESSMDYMMISSDIHPLEKILNDIRNVKNPGNNIRTSLNTTVQKAAHDALGLKEGAVVALDPRTGKVLAMVSKPDYDPNELKDNYESYIEDKESKVLLNQATNGLFTPGSIFKIITSIAYLRSGGDERNYEYQCRGYIDLATNEADSYINCYSGEVHGTLDFINSFADSCNASFANMGLRIGSDLLNETAESLLFNHVIDAGFSVSESRFSLSSNDSDWQIGATAIGQGDTMMTPLHAAMIAAMIANDGVAMKPYVVEAVENADGSVVREYKPESLGVYMSEEESDLLTDMMQEVVQSGTAYNLKNCAFEVAGKTGTAEVDGRGNNAWFVGFAPVQNPEIAICVLVEDAGTASSEAVPIAKTIFEAYFQ